MTCKEKILSEDFGEVILDFTLPQPPRGYCYKVINEEFGIAYVPLTELRSTMDSLYANQYLPKVFGLMQESPAAQADSGTQFDPDLAEQFIAAMQEASSPSHIAS